MSNSLTVEVASLLKEARGTCLFLTAGNPYRCDDGVGPYIAGRLKALGITNVLDAGQTPEDIVDDAIARRPRRVVIFDAASFGGRAGEVRLIPEEMIPETTLSTHSIPLNVISQVIQTGTRAEMFFVGIQGRSFALGEGLSDEVRRAAEDIVAAVADSRRERYYGE